MASDRHKSAYRSVEFLASPYSQAFFAAKPLRLLTVDRDVFSPQQDMQAARTKLAAFVRKGAQLDTQHLAITATRLLADDRPGLGYDPARPPLADINQRLELRGRLTICS